MDIQRLMLLRTMPYQEYLKTPEWKAKRQEVLIRDGNRCRNCNSAKDLNVHHRTYKRRGNEDPNDLTTLCENCHKNFHRIIKEEMIEQRSHSIPESAPLSEEEREKRNQENKLLWEDYLLGLLLLHPELMSYVRVVFSEEELTREDAKAIYCLLDALTAHEEGREICIPDQLLPSSLRMKACVTPGYIQEGPRLVKEVIQCAVRIKREKVFQLCKDLREELEVCYKNGDTKGMREIMIKQTHLDHRLRTIDEASKK